MLYIFTKSSRGAGGSRQRGFLVAEFIQKAGYAVELVVPPIYRKDQDRFSARIDYLKTIFSLRKGDIAFLQNPIFNNYFILLMCIVKIIFRPMIVFDFDDATWVQNPIAPRILALISNKAIVASHYLATWKNIRNKPILLMPNVVDYDLAKKYAKKYEINIPQQKIVLGWIGDAPASMNNLKLLLPVLTRLKEHGQPCIMRVIGTLGDQSVVEAFKKTGIECETIDKLDWAKQGEIQKANAGFDIGVCPLEYNESNKARCSLKVLDYMAAGIPVVITPIGENNYFITDGEEGFLPTTEHEWVEKLELLIHDKHRRIIMGQKAQEKIKNYYSYQSSIKRYISFLNL